MLLSLVFSTILFLNFDKTVTDGDRIITISPRSGVEWDVLGGSVDVTPLARRHLVLWEQPGRVCGPPWDNAVTVADVDAGTGHMQIAPTTLHDSVLCISLSPLDEGELIDLYVRIKVRESAVKATTSGGLLFHLPSKSRQLSTSSIDDTAGSL